MNVCKIYKIVSEFFILKHFMGTSLVVQWLRLCTSTAVGTGSVPVWEVPYVSWSSQENKKREREVITYMETY